ncbi:DUF1902 domain-containing protein [Photorhabdus laumondii]
MSNTVYKAHFGDRQTSFVVKITHDDVWIAECDELGLVTEAKSYDELTDIPMKIFGYMGEKPDDTFLSEEGILL